MVPSSPLVTTVYQKESRSAATVVVFFTSMFVRDSFVDIFVSDSTDMWIHVAATVVPNLNSMSIYHGGNYRGRRLVNSNGKSYTLSVMKSIVFGRQFGNVEGGYGSADVDDVRIYNNELDPSKVLALFNSQNE